MRTAYALWIVPTLACGSPSTIKVEGPGPAPSATPQTEPAPAPAPKQYANTSARLDLSDGVVLRAGFGQTHELERPTSFDRFELRLDGASGLLDKRSLKALTTTDAYDLLQPCDLASASVSKESWGERSGIRVSLVCDFGADFATAREFAILLQLPAGPVHSFERATVLWSGEADRSSNEMDQCVSLTVVKFSAQGKTLTRTIEETVVGEGEVDGQACKPGQSQRQETVAIP
jgi:hypothetical protein